MRFGSKLMFTFKCFIKPHGERLQLNQCARGFPRSRRNKSMYTRIMKSQFLPNKPTRRQQHIFRFLYLARNVPHESDNKTRRSSRVFSLSKAICRICIHFHTLAGRHIQQNKKQRGSTPSACLKLAFIKLYRCNAAVLSIFQWRRGAPRCAVFSLVYIQQKRCDTSLTHSLYILLNHCSTYQLENI